MNQTTTFLFLCIILSTSLAFVSRAETSSTLDIYVNNLSLSPSEDGSKNSPFKSLTEGLIAAQAALLPEVSIINIYIAPSSDSYLLGAKDYLFLKQENQKETILTISSWTDDSPCIAEPHCSLLPVLDFFETTIEFANMAIKISNVHILAKNGWTYLTSCSIVLRNVNILENQLRKAAFIYMEKGRDLNFEDINMTIVSANPFLHYEGAYQNPSVLLKNITVSVNEKEKLSFFPRPIFTITQKKILPKPHVSCTIEQFQLRSLKEQEESVILRALIVDGITSLVLKDFTFNNHTVTMSNVYSLVAIENVEYVELTNIHFIGNNISMLQKNPVFRITKLASLSITNLFLVNNTIKALMENSFSQFILLSQMNRVDSINHFLSNNTIDGNIEIIKVLRLEQSDSKAISVTIQDLNLHNNTNIISSNQFMYFNLQNTPIMGFEMKNVTYSMNKLSGRVFLLQGTILSSKFDAGQIISPNVLKLSDIAIQDNIGAVDTNFIYISPLIETLEIINCLPTLDLFRLSITNLTVTNNNFYKGENILWFNEVSLIQVQHTEVSMTSSIISNNFFEYYDFITIDQKASSIVLADSQVINNQFSFSHFVRTNYETAQGPCETSTNRNQGIATLLYRHSGIFNSIFSSLYLNSSSLLVLNNPYLIKENNSFTEIHLLESTFISASFYLNCLTTFITAYHNHHLIQLFSLGISDALKKSYFETLDEATTLYQITDPYFYRIYRNKFTNSTSTASKFFTFTGYGSKHFTSFDSNFFNNVNSSGNPLTSLVLGQKLRNIVIRKNIFESLNGRSVIFSLQTQISPLLKLDSNYANDLKIARFLTYEGDQLNRVQIINNCIKNSKFLQGGISLNAKTSSLDWMIDNNYFGSISLPVDPSIRQSEKYAFISLFTGTVLISTKITIQNSVIEGMVLYFNGHGNLSPEVSLFSVDTHQTVIFSNVTMKNTNFSSDGNLISLKNSRAFIILDCVVSNIKIQSTNGLISAFTKRLVVMDSSFSDIENAHEHGVFYLSPLVDSYKFEMTNCYFENIITLKVGILSVIPSFGYEVNPSFSIGKDDTYSLQINWNNITLKNIYNLMYVYLIDGICENCQMIDSNIILEIRRYTFNPSFKMLRAGGSFLLQNTTIPKRQPIAPFIEIHDSVLEFSLEKIHFKGENSILNLAKLNSGTFAIRDSIFEDISNAVTPIISAQFLEEELIYFSKNPKIEIFIGDTIFRRISSNLLDKFSLDNGLETLLQLEVNPNRLSFPVASIIFSSIPSTIFIADSIFEDVKNMSAVFVAQTKGYIFDGLKSPTIRLFDSTFRNFEFPLGSVLTVLPDCYHPTIYIKNSLFEHNKALLGGALAVYDGRVSIVNSIFKKNEAMFLGSAIYAGADVIKRLHTDEVTFLENKALEQREVVSEAVNMALLFVSDYPNGINAFSIIDFKNALILTNVSASEFQQGYIQMDFLDTRNKPTLDYAFSKQITFTLNSPKSDSKNGNTFAISVICESPFSCKIPLKGIALSGKANEDLVLKLQYKSERVIHIYSINITLRSCLPGEYNNSLTCEICPPGTFSTSPHRPCHQCPPNAICPMQAKICPHSGYWNVNENSSNILPCQKDDEGRCERDPGECRSCSKGYAGPLCSGCDFEAGYVESGYFHCKLCEEPTKELSIVIAGGALVLIWQALAIYLLYTGSKPSENNDNNPNEVRKIERSFYVKALITYLQLMSILSLTDPQIFNTFGLVSRVGSLSSLISYGTQCAMKALNIAPFDFIYYQTYLSVVAPFIQLIFIAFIITIAGIIKRDIQVRKIIAVAGLYLIISSQPGLVTNLTLFLSCKTIPDLGHYFITSHPNWTCDDLSYLSAARFIVLPNLILWLIVIPIILVTILFKKKSKLQSENLKAYFGMLTLDLKEKRYYWGIVLMVQKLALSVIMYGIEMKVDVQAFSFMLLMWIYQSLIRVFQPYSVKSYNTFEVALSNLVIFNIITAKYLLGSNYGELTRGISFAICIIINAIFILFVVFKILILTVYKKMRSAEEKFLGNSLASGGFSTEVFSTDNKGSN